MVEKQIRYWRVSMPDQGPGMFVWFDPDTELVTLRALTEDEKSRILDKQGSVSGLFFRTYAEGSDGWVSEESKTSQSFRQLKLFEEGG